MGAALNQRMPAIQVIIDTYVKFADERALLALQAHRQKLLAMADENNPFFKNLRAQCLEEISAIEEGLVKLRPSPPRLSAAPKPVAANPPARDVAPPQKQADASSQPAAGKLKPPLPQANPPSLPGSRFAFNAPIAIDAPAALKATVQAGPTPAKPPPLPAEPVGNSGSIPSRTEAASLGAKQGDPQLDPTSIAAAPLQVSRDGTAAPRTASEASSSPARNELRPAPARKDASPSKAQVSNSPSAPAKDVTPAAPAAPDPPPSDADPLLSLIANDPPSPLTFSFFRSSMRAKVEPPPARAPDVPAPATKRADMPSLTASSLLAASVAGKSAASGKDLEAELIGLQARLDQDKMR